MRKRITKEPVHIMNISLSRFSQILKFYYEPKGPNNDGSQDRDEKRRTSPPYGIARTAFYV